MAQTAQVETRPEPVAWPEQLEGAWWCRDCGRHRVIVAEERCLPCHNQHVVDAGAVARRRAR